VKCECGSELVSNATGVYTCDVCRSMRFGVMSGGMPAPVVTPAEDDWVTVEWAGSGGFLDGMFGRMRRADRCAEVLPASLEAVDRMAETWSVE